MTTPPVLTRRQLDRARCADPDCTSPSGCALFLSGNCHAGAPVRVVYTPGLDALSLSCVICTRPAGVVAIGAILDMAAVRCHPAAGCDVVYHAGMLAITCAACDRPLAEIQVAP
jgi:hypothetical protein